MGRISGSVTTATRVVLPMVVPSARPGDLPQGMWRTCPETHQWQDVPHRPMYLAPVSDPRQRDR